METSKKNLIDEWLALNGDPNITKVVEDTLSEMVDDLVDYDTQAVADCGYELYYELYKDSKEPFPPYRFFQKIEGYWIEWDSTSSELAFIDYCRNKINSI
jgi:hypothetical protein